MTLLETYLRELYTIRSTGAAVQETSYYPALSNLLNAVGKTIKPRVGCILHLQNKGAGIPDGGLFSQEQLQRADPNALLTGQIPSRGVLEVKGTNADVQVIAHSEQVEKYWQKYRQVLVTNYRDFAVVVTGTDGTLEIAETYRLADSETAFWQGAANPALLAGHTERFPEFMKRALMRPAPLTNPGDVAWFLASYAREALVRIEQGDLPALNQVRGAMEQALGIRFAGTTGEHFFRSTLVQTLFYGVFSAWVLWSKRHAPNSPERFDWRTSAWELHVPVIRVLFAELAKPATLQPLDLVETLQWAGDALNRVDRTVFFSAFAEGLAVQYFYEPFLQAFDPELRKQLGVWYTPPEVVEYMVSRVDTALREELGLEDGLADENVYILDPCCGTGAYLVHVLEHIHRTAVEKYGEGLAGQVTKQAAKKRVFGFEILPAPFVVSHLQMGLLLQRLNAPLSHKTDERACVFLTNALTGWKPPEGPKQHLLYPELEAERDAAEKVKQETPILVILGNPPYNGFAGMAVDEERELSNAYRDTNQAPKPEGHGLNDLYVRFFRMAERRIVENTRTGIVCFISNYSWLDGLSHTGMRERYLASFDSIWIDCLNGDKYKTGKVTPEGEPDPSIFSTESNREGIQVGTAIALMVRKEKSNEAKAVWFRHWWGKTKRADLLASLKPTQNTHYQEVTPPLELGLPFTHLRFNADYSHWPLLPTLFPFSSPGVTTSRDEVVVDIECQRLIERMKEYFDPNISHDEMRHRIPGAMTKGTGFDAIVVRNYLLNRGFLPQNVVRYYYRPFDLRWLYWERDTNLLDRKREDYFPQVFDGNIWIAAVQQNRKEFNPPMYLTRLAAYHTVERGANLFPLLIRPTQQRTLLDEDEAPRPNLSEEALRYLADIGVDRDAEGLFFHTLAVLHAPAYREENAGALRQDWPRVPLPDNAERLHASAELGRQIAALLDTERPVIGVTAGSIRAELRLVGIVARVDGGSLSPEDLAVKANWGYAGQSGVTMPARGRMIERDYTTQEREALGVGNEALECISKGSKFDGSAKPDQCGA